MITGTNLAGSQGCEFCCQEAIVNQPLKCITMNILRALVLTVSAVCFGSTWNTAVYGSILSNVPSGGWGETQPGGGKWDDQNVGNPGPFPNVSAALTAAGLPTAGLTKVVKIEDPNTTGSGLGVSFTITGQGTTSGTWTINQGDLNLTGGLVLAYFSLKGAQTWNLWTISADTDVNPATYTNAWDTNSSGGGLLTPNGNSFAGLSHITFWAIEAPDPTQTDLVPEPWSVAVWGLLAIGGVVYGARRPRVVGPG